ncbi:MAG: hypothetical protein ACI389_02340 [Methanobrevibacter sp.]|uniref:hypothetical protein n=1 Tax=Methanobrevibacter sp. TaxID=66852 RepID=UPI003F05E4C7
MICKFCGKEFTKRHNSEKYCSNSCKIAAKKLQDAANSHKAYMRNKSKKPMIWGTCEYCGEEFIKSHGNQKYCSKTCSENKNRELNADAANKYYHHVKKLRGGDTVWGLGSGSLGPHMHDDLQVEIEKIENEMRRLRLLL